MRISDSRAPRFWHLALLICAQACTVVRTADVAPAMGETTVVVVRHAEKSTDDPRDPSLSAIGQERALALSALLRDAGVTGIYTTHYKRTRQTAEPFARQSGIAITERPIGAANSATYARDLAREVLARRGTAVLIVGHSNTVPEIVTALSGRAVAPMTEAEYDHAFIVVIPATGTPRLLHTRFGRPGA